MNIDDLREAFKAWNQEQIEANAPQEEIYITAKEAAKMLGVTLSTLWRWDNDKYLEKIRTCKKVLTRNAQTDYPAYYSGMGDGLSINLDRQIKGGCI